MTASFQGEADGHPTRRAGQGRRRALTVPRELPLVIAIVLVAVTFQSLTGIFLKPRNLINLLAEASPLILVAVASTIVILMGDIDLSLGSVAGLTAAVAAFLLGTGFGWGWALVLALVGAGLIGLVQGAIVVFAGVRSFVVTLAGFLICFGLQLRMLSPTGYLPVETPLLRQVAVTRLPTWVVLSIIAVLVLVYAGQRLLGGRAATRAARPERDTRQTLILGGVLLSAVLAACYLGTAGGVPVLTALALAVTALAWIVLRKTGPGLHLYAIGGDESAALESGIRVRQVKLGGFVATGILAGLAGLTLLIYTSGADNTTGSGTLLLSGIGSAVVGGVSMLGGRGSVWGAVGGALLLASVQNGLNLISLLPDMVYVVSGAVVLAALLIDAVLRKKFSVR